MDLTPLASDPVTSHLQLLLVFLTLHLALAQGPACLLLHHVSTLRLEGLQFHLVEKFGHSAVHSQLHLAEPARTQANQNAAVTQSSPARVSDGTPIREDKPAAVSTQHAHLAVCPVFSMSEAGGRGSQLTALSIQQPAYCI